MTTTTAKKPRRARRRKPTVKPMTSESYEVGTPLDHANLIEYESKVIITEQRRKLNELTLFELGLLPFLYLEYFTKKVYDRLSPKASS